LAILSSALPTAIVPQDIFPSPPAVASAFPPTVAVAAPAPAGPAPTVKMSSTASAPAATVAAIASRPAVGSGLPPIAAPTVPVGLPVRFAAGLSPQPVARPLPDALSPRPALH